MNYVSALIELQYLPCIEYISYVYHFKEIHIEKQENFVKQSYRNRCRIRGANSVEELIIPIKHSENRRIDEVLIDDQQKWLGVHQRAIMSAYGKAPYFEYFSEEIFSVFRKKHKKLFDLTFDLLTKCLDILKIDRRIYFTDSFDILAKNAQIDLRGVVHPKRKKNIGTNFVVNEYPQVFGKNFVENLSILDLLFCAGKDAVEIIKKSLQFEKDGIKL